MKTHDIDAVTRGLDPGRQPQISETAWTDLSAGITESVEETPAPRTPVRPRVLLAAAGLLVFGGIVAATVVNLPGQDLPQALSVTDQGEWLTVRVIDETADPEAYNQQFERLGLDITVKMVPVSPAYAGKYATFGYQVGSEGTKLKLLEPGEDCPATLNATDPGCQYGVEVGKTFKGKAEINFGRTARPGERYWASLGEANAAGEELAGVSYRNQRVTEVQKLLVARGMAVGAYYNSKMEVIHGVNTAKEVDPVPGDWYVHSISPDSPRVVSLWIGPEPEK